jgi:hypothetical protein
MELINAVDEYLLARASWANFAMEVLPTIANAVAPNALPVFVDELLQGKGKVTLFTMLVP